MKNMATLTPQNKDNLLKAWKYLMEMVSIRKYDICDKKRFSNIFNDPIINMVNLAILDSDSEKFIYEQAEFIRDYMLNQKIIKLKKKIN